MADDEDAPGWEAADDDAAFAWLQAAVQELLDTPRVRPEEQDTDAPTLAV
jgi:hypothetical protein